MASLGWNACAPEIVEPDYWCQSEMDMSKFSYLWTIKNFSLCPLLNGQPICSSTVFSPNNASKWRIDLFYRIHSEDLSDWISLSVRLVESRQPIRLQLKMSLLNNQRCKIVEKSPTSVMLLLSNDCYNYYQFIKRSDVFDPSKGILNNDILNIYVEFSTSIESFTRNPIPPVAEEPSDSDDSFSFEIAGDNGNDEENPNPA